MKHEFHAILGQYTRADYHVIYNGFENNNSIAPAYLENNKLVMLYAGSFYGQRKLKYLAKPIQKMILSGKLPSDKLQIHIFGRLSENDSDEFIKCGIRHIVNEHAQIPHSDLIRLMKGADILLLLSGNDVDYAIPYKFYDYLSVKRPILLVTDKGSAISLMLSELDAGEICLIEDPESVYTALDKILNKKKTYSFVGINKYSWRKISQKYIEILS
jgi:glycosyltransferase involved in cell wall biosynthesis